MISLGHCIGMCGPLVGAYSLAQSSQQLILEPGREPSQNRDQESSLASGQKQAGKRQGWVLLPVLLVYHLGRLVAYGLIGLGFGLLGSAARLAGGGLVLQGSLSILAGLLMGLLGLGLLGWLPTQRWVESSQLGQTITSRLPGLLQTNHSGGRFLLGMANGFLPCGPVYAMALATVAAAKPVLGAGAMLLYGLGTVPVLLALGLGAGKLPPTTQARFFRVGAVLVLLIGLQLALRGFAALDWIGHLRFGEVVVW
jgi:sulfite exporter TauE/SafE